jgi:hypothetical protein
MAEEYDALEHNNIIACGFLDIFGYNGSLLLAKVERKGFKVACLSSVETMSEEQRREIKRFWMTVMLMYKDTPESFSSNVFVNCKM